MNSVNSNLNQGGPPTATAAAPNSQAQERSGSAAPARSLKPFLILGAVVALGGLVAAGYVMATAGQESTDDAQVEADVVPISARVSGQVLKRLVEDNQNVKRGDPIVLIDDADFAARARQAEAEFAVARAQADAADAQVQVIDATAKGGLYSAKAQYSGSSMGVANAAAQLAAARAGLERARAEARKSELDLARTRQLVEQNALPKEQLDNAQVAYDAAHAAQAQAQAQVIAAEEMKRVAASRVAEAKGKLDQSTPIDAANCYCARQRSACSRSRRGVRGGDRARSPAVVVHQGSCG